MSLPYFIYHAPKRLFLFSIGKEKAFSISECGLRIAECCDTMGKRMGRIGRIRTDFFCFASINTVVQKKSVLICPIRTIRSPIVSQHYNPKSTFPNRKKSIFISETIDNQSLPKSEIKNPKSQ
jgi:hypothetical protein